MLGGSFLLLWFSITYSPFAPREWVSSVSVERRRVDRAYEEPLLTTDHPVALFAFFGPVALAAAGGAVFGAVNGVYEVKS
jgi:hypothetical protein